jgi:hypothetical protein
MVVIRLFGGEDDDYVSRKNAGDNDLIFIKIAM